MKSCLCILLVLVPALASMATVVHVPADQPTIQAGLDAASNGDTVAVAAGTYTGDGNRDIDFKGKQVLLLGTAGPASTTIDCQGSSSDPHIGIWFHTAEDTSAIVDGFTVTGAWKKLVPPYDFQMSGAIECDACSPTVRNCVMTGNYGAGLVSLLNANPRVHDCTMKQNHGHGVRCGFSGITGSANIVLERCVISENDSMGIYLMYVADHVIRNCTVVQNGKDGVRYWSDLPFTATADGGSAHYQLIENTIVAFNAGYGTYTLTLGFPQIPVRCSDVYGNTQGNYSAYSPDTADCIATDPMFCDTATANYHVKDNSPCVPANNRCGVLMGALPVGCNCCEGAFRGNVNMVGIIDLSDLSTMIAYLISPLRPTLPCLDEADLTGNGVVDLTDLSKLIYYLTCSNCGPDWPCPGY